MTSKEDQMIMVVPTKELLREHFEGFKIPTETDYESLILEKHHYTRRGPAEFDPTYKQPIGYALVVNPNTKTVFAYQRSSKDKNYGEKRLQGKWSLGIGGHIEQVDSENGNPIYTSLRREIEEEIGLSQISEIKVLGYINDDSDSVGKVHFGILYLVETNQEVITPPKDGEMSSGSLIPINELEKIVSTETEIESWSKIALGPLKDYFKNLN